MTIAKPTENDVKTATKRLLDKHRWFHFSVPGTGFGSNGVSDRIAVKHGMILAIENKKGEAEEPHGTALQERFLMGLREIGGGTGLVVNMRMIRDGTFERLLVDLDSRWFLDTL